MGDSGSRRLLFLDRLRGLAVVAMFFVHTTVAWLRPEFKVGTYFHVMMKISGLVAPTFLFLVGLSVVLAWRAAEQRGRLEALRRRLVLRGLGIWIAGYLLQLLFWSFDHFDGPIDHAIRVDILQCIGSALVFLPLLAPPRRVNLPALVLFLFLPILSHVLFYVSAMDDLPRFLAAYLSTSSRLAQFPVVPNWGWIALGLFVGGIWDFARKDRRRELLFWAGLTAMAVVLFYAARQVHWYYYHRFIYRYGLRWYAKPTRGLLHHVWFKAVWVLALFGLSRMTGLVLDSVEQSARRRGTIPWAPSILFGRTSLFAYSLHLGLIYYGLGRPLCRHIDPTRQLMGALAIGALTYVASVLWFMGRPGFWRGVRRLRGRVAGALKATGMVPQ